MKKIWKRFKIWLVHKLGGHMAPDKTVTIEHTAAPFVTLVGTVADDLWRARAAEAQRDSEYLSHIGDALIGRLAEEIRDYIDITTCDNEWEGKRYYRATIKIVGRRK